MMFRQAPLHHAMKGGHVMWGPFPARWGVLGMAIAFGFVGAMMLLITLQHEHFQCPVTGTCTVDGKPVFPRESIARVDVVIERGSKNAKYGVIVVALDRGRTWRLMRIDPDDANDAARTIRAQLAAGAAIDVDLHNPKFLGFVGVAGVIAFFVFIAIAFARMGHFDLIVSPDGQTLDVRRSLFGIPLGTRRVPLARVEGVTVERTTISPPLRGRYEALTPAARLVLRYRGGATEAITTPHFPGHALHLRAAWALRRALDVEDDPRDDAELARIPMRTTAMGQRLGFAWAGVTTGSLVGLALFGVTMIALKQTHARDNIETWMFLSGAIPGAIGGAAVVFHATRTRLPR